MLSIKAINKLDLKIQKSSTYYIVHHPVVFGRQGQKFEKQSRRQRENYIDP